MLPAPQRLRSRRDFRLVYARGRSYVHPMLVLYVRRTGASGWRVGFSVSKKLGGAVERNRVKRRLREACRARSGDLRPGFDAVFVARSRLKEVPFETVQRVVDELFGRAGLRAAPSASEREPCGEPPLS